MKLSFDLSYEKAVYFCAVYVSPYKTMQTPVAQLTARTGVTYLSWGIFK